MKWSLLHNWDLNPHHYLNNVMVPGLVQLEACQNVLNIKKVECERLIHSHHDAIRARDASKKELEEVGRWHGFMAQAITRGIQRRLSRRRHPTWVCIGCKTTNQLKICQWDLIFGIQISCFSSHILKSCTGLIDSWLDGCSGEMEGWVSYLESGKLSNML